MDIIVIETIHFRRGKSRIRHDPAPLRRTRSIVGQIDVENDLRVFITAVRMAFNNAARTGNGEIVYLASTLTTGGYRLKEKLYQARVSTTGGLWAAFYEPSGEIMRMNAGLSMFFSRSDKIYSGIIG